MTMRFIRALLCTLIVALTVVTIAPPAITQPAQVGPRAGKKGGKKGDRRQARKRLAKLRKRVLRKKVGLSDAKIDKVVAILEGQQAQRHALEKRIRSSRKAMGQLFKTDSSDQAAYARHLDALQEGHRGLGLLRDEQLSELRKVLQPKEQAKLLRAMELVKRRFNKKRRGRKKRKR
jgi:Spy/CpxP family protein refolding chaperone